MIDTCRQNRLREVENRNGQFPKLMLSIYFVANDAQFETTIYRGKDICRQRHHNNVIAVAPQEIVTGTRRVRLETSLNLVV
jgi:hypothetical protein